MEHKKICEVGKQWVAELIALGATQDILPLLTPDNIQIGEQGIALKNKNVQGLQLYLYSGYSAPEIYQGRPSAASSVYFVGAVLYALYTGATPPDAPARVQQGTLLLAQTDPLAAVINRATMPHEAQRIGSLQQLWQELQAAENSVAPPAPAASAPVPPAQEPQPAAALPDEAPKAQVVEPVAAEKPKEATVFEQAPVAQEAPEKEQDPKEDVPASKEEQGTPPLEKAQGQPAEAAPAPSPAEETPAGAAPAANPPQAEPGFAVLGPVSTAAFAPASGTPQAPATQPAPMGMATGSAFGQPAAAYAPGQPPAAQNAPAFGYGAQQPAAGAQPGQMPPAKPKKKVSKKAILIAAAVVVVLAVAAVVYTLVQSSRIDNAFAQGDYATVVSAADMTPWLKNGKRQQYDYARAHLLMEEGNTQESLEIFEELGDYENSPKLVQSLKYDLAGQMMKEGKLKEALALYKELRTYKDSTEMAEKLETYMGAERISDPLEQYTAYASLGDFLDSPEKAAGLAGEIYEEGIARYGQQDFVNAKDYFEVVGDYEKAPQYLEACNIYLEASDYYYNFDYMGDLERLSQDIDVSAILFTDKFFWEWLDGSWTSPTAGDFRMNARGKSFTWALISGSGSYQFTEGKIYTDSGTQLVATFAYVDYDHFVITMADGGEHAYTRN